MVIIFIIIWWQKYSKCNRFSFAVRGVESKTRNRLSQTETEENEPFWSKRASVSEEQSAIATGSKVRKSKKKQQQRQAEKLTLFSRVIETGRSRDFGEAWWGGWLAYESRRLFHICVFLHNTSCSLFIIIFYLFFYWSFSRNIRIFMSRC